MNMMYRYALLVAATLAVFGSQAHACGPTTLDMVKAMDTVDKPPLFRCGSDFNKPLELAHRKDWAGPLTHYQAHLRGLGRWEAGTKQANDTVEYLRMMARAK